MDWKNVAIGCGLMGLGGLLVGYFGRAHVETTCISGHLDRMIMVKEAELEEALKNGTTSNK